MRLSSRQRIFELAYDDVEIGSFMTARECADAFHRHRTLTVPPVDITKYSIKRGNEPVGIKRLLRWAKSNPVPSAQRP
jgi:hypothetical protein